MFDTFGKKRSVRDRFGIVLKSLARMVTCAVVLVQACHQSEAGTPSVSDTGYEIIHMILTPSLYWVDNTHLLFAGINRAEMQAAIDKKESDRVTRLKKLYLWDYTTKSVRLYADAQSVCFSQGIIHYTVRVDKAAGKAIVREGQLGSEKEIEKPLTSKAELSTQERMGTVVNSNFSCKTHLRSELKPPAPHDHYVVILREGDGYLDLRPGDIKEELAYPRNVTLYDGNTGKATQLPITREEEVVVSYSAYREAYVLKPALPRGTSLGIRKPWPKDLPLIVYLLWANGRVESTSIPYSPSEYLYDPQPVKVGWIFGGGNFYKAAGLYLFDGGKVSKLDAGLVKEIAVTPDGCKAAVGIQNKHLEMGTPINLRIFNFCVGGH